MNPDISPDVANHVLFYFGAGGYRPGSFTESLMRTIALADITNSARLAVAFPEYVAAMDMGLYGIAGGLPTLYKLAEVAS